MPSAEDVLRARRYAEEEEKRRLAHEEDRKVDVLRKQINTAAPGALKRLEAAGWAGGELVKHHSTEVARWSLGYVDSTKMSYGEHMTVSVYLYSDGSVADSTKSALDSSQFTSDSFQIILDRMNKLG